MSLDKSIQNGRERRRRYYRRCFIIDRSCRPHGGKTKRRCRGQCLYCLGNRRIQTERDDMRVKGEIDGYTD